MEEAKNLFINKQYQVALPAFKKLVSQQPANPNYNYCYGTCLLKTGSAKQAVKYLEFADKRKVGDASFYLGQAYEELYQFNNATTCYEAFRNQLLKRKDSTSEIDKLITRSKNGQNMLLGVEKVCVLDSFQIDKERFLSAYKLSKECGKLYMYKDFFKEQIHATVRFTRMREETESIMVELKMTIPIYIPVLKLLTVGVPLSYFLPTSLRSRMHELSVPYGRRSNYLLCFRR